MPYKMTEEYASAMVTVIPIILLVAAVEYSTLKRARDQAAAQELKELRGLVRAVRHRQELSDQHREFLDNFDHFRSDGGVPPLASVVDPLGTSRARWITGFWYTIALSHILAEVILIGWLAGTEREPEPFTAQFVMYVAFFGFLGILLQPLLQQQHAERARTRYWAALDAEITELQTLVKKSRAEGTDSAAPPETPDASPQ